MESIYKFSVSLNLFLSSPPAVSHLERSFLCLLAETNRKLTRTDILFRRIYTCGQVCLSYSLVYPSRQLLPVQEVGDDENYTIFVVSMKFRKIYIYRELVFEFIAEQ